MLLPMLAKDISCKIIAWWFQITLLELFPKEAGTVADSERIMPHLPGELGASGEQGN